MHGILFFLFISFPPTNITSCHITVFHSYYWEVYQTISRTQQNSFYLKNILFWKLILCRYNPPTTSRFLIIDPCSSQCILCICVLYCLLSIFCVSVDCLIPCDVSVQTSLPQYQCQPVALAACHCSSSAPALMTAGEATQLSFYIWMWNVHVSYKHLVNSPNTLSRHFHFWSLINCLIIRAGILTR